jgi:hypothetical protein
MCFSHVLITLHLVSVCVLKCPILDLQAFFFKLNPINTWYLRIGDEILTTDPNPVNESHRLDANDFCFFRLQCVLYAIRNFIWSANFIITLKSI